MRGDGVNVHGHRYGPVTTIIPDSRGDSEDGEY